MNISGNLSVVSLIQCMNSRVALSWSIYYWHATHGDDFFLDYMNFHIAEKDAVLVFLGIAQILAEEY